MKYIKSNFEEDLHFYAAFDGSIFDRTAKMLQFDLYGLESVVGISDSSIERMIIYDDDIVIGVAVCVFFKEFIHVLDYERYMIIAADSKEVFCKLLAYMNINKSRLELITFRNRERQFLEEYKRQSYIHYWNVYEIMPHEVQDEISRIPFTKFRLKDMEGLDLDGKSESNPIRYSFFQNSNLEGYSVWTLHNDEGMPVFVGSVIPYVDRIAEIKIFIIAEELCCPQSVANFMRGIVGECVGSYDSAIFRVKRCSELISKILSIGNFKCISQEQHIHIAEV